LALALAAPFLDFLPIVALELSVCG